PFRLLQPRAHANASDTAQARLPVRRSALQMHRQTFFPTKNSAWQRASISKQFMQSSERQIFATSQNTAPGTNPPLTNQGSGADQAGPSRPCRSGSVLGHHYPRGTLLLPVPQSSSGRHFGLAGEVRRSLSERAGRSTPSRRSDTRRGRRSKLQGRASARPRNKLAASAPASRRLAPCQRRLPPQRHAASALGRRASDRRRDCRRSSLL